MAIANKNLKNGISIIVPTLNEEGNVQILIEIINKSLKQDNIAYEIIFVDDHSSDKTKQRILSKSKDFPVKFFDKVGQKGKAFSILEGFNYINFKNICMIDADLQYPPSAIPSMFHMVNDDKADIVVANRKYIDVRFTRKLPSFIFKFIFGKLLHGLDCDVQSGLKVFKYEVTKNINILPSPWTFDLEFLLQAKKKGYRIGNFDIDFSKRLTGDAKINILNATYEIGLSAIKLKFKKF